MRKSTRVVIAASLVPVAALFPGITFGALTAQGILALPSTTRLEVVRASLRERASQLSNYEAKCTVEARNGKLRGDDIVDNTPLIVRYEYRVLGLGGSLRMECVQTDFKDNRSQEMFRWQSSHIEELGVYRGFTKYPDGRAFARIGYKGGHAEQFNYLVFFLHGQISEIHKAYLDQILADESSISVEPSSDPQALAIVLLPKRPDKTVEFVEKVELQPNRGFSIKSYHADLARIINGKMTPLTRMRVDVVDEKQVDGVWFPMRIDHRVLKPESQNGTKSLVTVQSVKLGAVREADLSITFPEGAEVNDQIEQKAYVEGRREDSLVDYAGKTMYKPPSAVLKEKMRAEGPRRPWYFWLNVCLVVMTAGLLILRRVRSKSA